MSAPSLCGASLQAVHSAFLAELPRLDRFFRFQFRTLPKHRRAEAIADARAACWHAWSGLVRRGKDPVAIGPAGIAANAARYVKNGRQLGCGASGRGAMDVYHPRVQRGGLKLISLDRSVERDAGARPDVWRDWLAEDKRTTLGDATAFRLDLAAWLDGLPPRKREMAELLAQGFGTSEVATLLGITPAAVSIARAWLEGSWLSFQGEPVQEDYPSVRKRVGLPRKEDRDPRRRWQGTRAVIREMAKTS